MAPRNRALAILPFFFLFLSLIKCSNLEEIAEKLDRLVGVKSSRIPRDTEDSSPIWLEYEFNTGAGNREELVVTNITVQEYANLPEAGSVWQYLEVNRISYLIRTEKSALSLYKLYFDDTPIDDPIDLTVEGAILTSKTIGIRSATPNSEIDLVVVLCVESDSGTSLRWYRLLNESSFEFFWWWPVQKHIKDMEFFQYGNQNKLLLLNKDEIRFGKQDSSIDVYGFSIDFSNDAFHFWLCQRSLVPRVFDIRVCSIYESIYLALQSVNAIFLYKYRDTTVSSIFQELQTIKSQDLKNFVCFESGYFQFLAISGPEAGLFHFYEGEFQYNAKSESSFDVSDISWVKDVRLNTYRDESLLLIQLRNSTVIALAWQGLSFKRIQLPSNILDQFDLSTVTVVPKFGFVVGNKFARIRTDLKNLKHPIQHTTERLLTLQRLLNDSLNYQEKILNETKMRLEKSYLKKPIAGVWNMDTVNATNAVITDNVTYHSVTIGSVNLTKEELEFDVNAYTEALKDLEQKLEEIDENLIDAEDSNSTALDFDSEVEIFGNFHVTGNLNVENLTAEYINDVDASNDVNSLDGNNTIEEKKVLAFTEADNLTVYSLNGIPVNDIRFSESMKNYHDVNFSRINRVEVGEHLFFDAINGVEWKKLMESVVWTDRKTFIPGDTVVEGTLTADTIDVDFLNDLRYPEDYVSADSNASVNITGIKSFAELEARNLKDVKTINGIDIEDFVILNKDNVLKEEITFENLTIENNLQIDGDIAGLEKEDTKLLNETSRALSNVIFSKLEVLGSVTFDSSFMDKRRLNFEDLLLRTENDVEITGTKTFLGNVGIKSNLTITSRTINGHFVDDFVTLDTDQQLPNLRKISSDVTFGNVTYGAIKELESNLEENANSTSNCLKKIIVFKSPITVDELYFDSLNDKISSEDFARKFNETFRNIRLEKLKTETLEAEEIVPKIINGIDFASFVKHLSDSNVPDEYAIDKLETDHLYAKVINGISVDEINEKKDQLNALLGKIFNGSASLESLRVTGMITAKSINGKNLKEFFQGDGIGTVIFKNNVSIENLTILGSMNGFDFLERVSDTVLKTDRNIKIDGRKTFDTVNCNELEAVSLNKHPLKNIFDPFREQALKGPVVVNGSVTVLNEFNASRNIGDVAFHDLMDRFKSFGNDTYELRGNARFPKDAFIENLFANGTIQERGFDDFVSTTVPKNEDNVTISGAKVFQTSVTFNGSFFVRDRLNDIDLKRFQEKAVFVDVPFSVKSKLVFKDGMKIEKDIAVKTDFEAKSLMGVDVNELRLNVLYLNRPTYVKETITLGNATFQSDIEVSRFNDLDASLLIPLHTEQIIPVEVLKCRTITADEINVLGNINGENLKTLQGNTFMLSGEQNITGHIDFRGHVEARHDFNVRLINGMDPSKFVSLNSKGVLAGDFVFENPVVLNQGLRVLGYLNGIDPNRWDAVAVTTNNPLQQIISGRWTVVGNVYFENGAVGSDTLNGTDLTELSNALAKNHLEMDAATTETNENLESVCEDLTQLKRYAEKQIYKFSVFDYLQIVEFDDIASIHYFELRDLDYLLISYDSCYMHMYLFSGEEFELIANVSDFGVVDRWTTFKHDEILYFLTSGSDSCGRGPMNVWKLEDDEFVHVLSLGSKIDSKKIDQDAFLMLINKHGEERSMEQAYKELEESPLSLADEDDAKIVLKDGQMLLSSRRAISEQDSDRASNASIGKHHERPQILNFKAGVFEKNMFLYYDEEISKDHIFICSNDPEQKKILQTINAHRPTSFTILNFEGSIETLLVFVENRKNIQIYDYRGIQGFLYRDSIRINVDRMLGFKIRKYSNLAKRHCLALIHENRLTILEAKMYGEKLDMEKLTCSKR